jgi:ribosomal peptide maturation radical SAM protein 1
MPWAAVTEPSLGLAILKSHLKVNGCASEISHCNLLLLKQLKFRTYRAIADLYAINDFLFSGTFDHELDFEQLNQLSVTLKDIPAHLRPRETVAETIELLLHLRENVIPSYIDECVSVVLQDSPRIVGLSCMYDQTFASLALVEHIKRVSPETLIVLGGYAVFGETGQALLRSFPSIDAIVNGEGEVAVVRLCREDREDWKTIPNLITRETISPPKQAPFICLDEVLYPDFDDYFEDIADLENREKIKITTPYLPIETSRGCWWGQKNHCIFCGIDDASMTYRRKSGAGALAMMQHLAGRHGISSFRISDYILPMEYFKSVLPKLAAGGAPYVISCESKSNLRADHFDAFQKAGVLEVQPGIESFSTPVLKLMKKGVSGIQNVRTLKLAAHFGIKLHYNIIYGFPGDEEPWYLDMLNVVPSLYHLEPPETCSRVAVTRFAPLHMNAKSFFGVDTTLLRANDRYSIILAKTELARRELRWEDYCYYFVNPVEDESLEPFYEALEVQARYWMGMEGRCDLVVHRLDGVNVIKDTRIGQHASALTEVERSILDTCNLDIWPIDKLFFHLEARYSAQMVADALSHLKDLRSIFEESNSIIGLPLMQREHCDRTINISH